MAKANVASFIDPSLKATAIDVKQLPLCPTELPNDAVSKLRVKATIWK